jgi:hypothetical protein
MTQAEAVLLAYLIVWTLWGHWYVLRRWDERQKHKRRSKAALKTAATRKRNSPSNGRGVQPKPEKKPRARKAKPPLKDHTMTAESAWFKLLNDVDEVDYNELDMGEAWRPQVRRFDGTAREYAARDDSGGSVEG